MKFEEVQDTFINTTVQMVNRSKIDNVNSAAKAINQEIIKTISALITLFQEDAFKALTVEDVFIMRPLLTNMRNNAKRFSENLGEALYAFDHVDPEHAKSFIKNHSKIEEEQDE